MKVNVIFGKIVNLLRQLLYAIGQKLIVEKWKKIKNTLAIWSHWCQLAVPFKIVKKFQSKIKQEHGIECYMPANGETETIETPVDIPAALSAR